MSRFRLSSLLLAAGVALTATVLAFAAPAAAGPPAVASGSAQFIPTGFATRNADGNVFIQGTGLLAYTAGAIAGTTSETYRFVIHKDGSIEGFGRGVCSGCSIGSRSGSFDAVFTAHGSLSTGLSGRVTITGASGSLKGTHGGGFYQQDYVTGIDSYSLSLVFAP